MLVTNETSGQGAGSGGTEIVSGLARWREILRRRTYPDGRSRGLNSVSWLQIRFMLVMAPIMLPVQQRLLG